MKIDDNNDKLSGAAAGWSCANCKKCHQRLCIDNIWYMVRYENVASDSIFTWIF